MTEEDEEGVFISPFGTVFTRLRARRMMFGADGVNRIITIETARGETYKILYDESCRIFLNGEEQKWTPPIQNS